LVKAGLSMGGEKSMKNWSTASSGQRQVAPTISGIITPVITLVAAANGGSTGTLRGRLPVAVLACTCPQ